MAASSRSAGLGGIVDGYLHLILDSIPEHKVLIMDAFTTGVVSQVKGQTEMLELGVYLFNQLGKRPENKSEVGHLSAVVLVRPTKDNITKLENELRAPKHSNYHIFFTNVLPLGYLDRIAEADRCELVVQVKEVFLDYVPVNPNLWHLRIPNGFSMQNDTLSSHKLVEFHVEAIISNLLACKIRPQIRYEGSSKICRKLAKEVHHKIDNELGDLFHWQQRGEPLLLILDRTGDPVTPLLSQWTYQAMSHELIGIDNSRVKAGGELGEIVLNTFEDEFFRRHMMSNFGELGVAVKELVEKYQVKRGQTGNIESIEDMQNFVDNYGEYQQTETNVSKHVGLLTELSRIVNERKLLEISALEQEIACTENMSRQYEEIRKYLCMHAIRDEDKLRLVLLYSLRYENAPNNNLPLLRDLLRQQAKTELARKRVDFTTLLLNTCGARKRAHDIFGNQSLTGRLGGFLKGIKGVENIYTQHEPYLARIIDDILKKDLKLQDYPLLDGSLNKRHPPTDIVIFIVGGVTFEEAAMVHSKSIAARKRIILGGTCVHNSESFLQDLNSSSSFRIPTEDELALFVDEGEDPSFI